MKGAMHRTATKKPCFRYFCRFVTRALTRTQQNAYIYVFRAFFALSKFQATCCCFYQLRMKSFHSALDFELKETEFLASQCTSLLLRRKPVQRNYLLSKISNRRAHSVGLPG